MTCRHELEGYRKTEEGYRGIIYQTASTGMTYYSFTGVLLVMTLVTMIVTYKMNQWMSDWIKSTDNM